MEEEGGFPLHSPTTICFISVRKRAAAVNSTGAAWRDPYATVDKVLTVAVCDRDEKLNIPLLLKKKNIRTQELLS